MADLVVLTIGGSVNKVSVYGMRVNERGSMSLVILGEILGY